MRECYGGWTSSARGIVYEGGDEEVTRGGGRGYAPWAAMGVDREHTTPSSSHARRRSRPSMLDHARILGPTRQSTSTSKDLQPPRRSSDTTIKSQIQSTPHALSQLRTASQTINQSTVKIVHHRPSPPVNRQDSSQQTERGEKTHGPPPFGLGLSAGILWIFRAGHMLRVWSR